MSATVPAPTSLRARAMAWLAQREHSRSELRRKLQRLLSERARNAVEPVPTADEPIEPLLDWLQSNGLLSDERFADSRVRLRAAGRGSRRIEHELAQHGLKLTPQALRELRDSELQRAMQLWRRRFGALPTDARERQRQMRFLAGRGFGAEVIRRVVASAADGHDPLPDDAA